MLRVCVCVCACACVLARACSSPSRISRKNTPHLRLRAPSIYPILLLDSCESTTYPKVLVPSLYSPLLFLRTRACAQPLALAVAYTFIHIYNQLRVATMHPKIWAHSPTLPRATRVSARDLYSNPVNSGLVYSFPLILLRARARMRAISRAHSRVYIYAFV